MCGRVSKNMGVQMPTMEDKRLDRLYDYTKFHIGIYLSAAGGIAAWISNTAESKFKDPDFISKFFFHWTLVVSFLFMVLAGIAGAVIATSAIKSESYQDFIQTRQGAYGFEPFLGKTWTTLEHAFFWLSLFLMIVSVFSANAVLAWLGLKPT